MWSYNAEEHWRTKHLGVPMPEEFRTAVEISSEEHAAVENWSSKATSKRKAKADTEVKERQDAVRARAEEKQQQQLGRGKRKASAGGSSSEELPRDQHGDMEL